MAVRQYIGARYVPRFTGLYDNTQSYEALDVVDNGSGTSYIAKKPTPAGTPLTDTDYWFLYGSTNGAIVNLQDQINDMKDGTVPGSLQEQINTNASGISALTNIVQPNRVFAIIADSYGTIPSATRGFFDQIESIITANGYTAYTRGSGGSGYSKIGTDGTFYNEFLALEQSFADPDAITDIVILGGSNDVTETNSDVVSGYQTLKNYFDTNYPNAKVHCAFTGYGVSIASNYAYQKNYVNLIATMNDLCNQYSNWRMIHGIEYIMHAYFLLGSDHEHPNSTGASFLGKAIANSLIKNCDYNFKLTSNVNFKMGTGTAVSGSIDFDNNITTLHCPTSAIGVGDSFVFPNTGLINIGVYSPTIINNKGKKYPVIVRASSTQTAVFSGYVVFYENRIDWESLDTTSLTGQTNVTFEGIDVVFDTLSI